MAKGQESLQSLEGQFARANDALHEMVLDLNASQKDTADAMTALLSLRQKLLGMYVIAPDPRRKPAALALAGAGAGTAAPGFTWINKLNETMAKALKRPLSKGECIYTTEVADEADQTYIATLSSFHFKDDYKGASPSVGKRQAEHAAAKAAMEAEYPEAHARLENSDMSITKPAAGTKRKAPDTPSAVPPEGKNTLRHVVQLLLQRNVTKEDFIYVITYKGDGLFSATLTLPSYQGSPSYSGEAATQKDAEMNAAWAACAQLESVAAPLVEKQKAKKASKMAEKAAAKAAAA